MQPFILAMPLYQQSDMELSKNIVINAGIELRSSAILSFSACTARVRASAASSMTSIPVYQLDALEALRTCILEAQFDLTRPQVNFLLSRVLVVVISER